MTKEGLKRDIISLNYQWSKISISNNIKLGIEGETAKLIPYMSKYRITDLLMSDRCFLFVDILCLHLNS